MRTAVGSASLGRSPIAGGSRNPGMACGPRRRLATGRPGARHRHGPLEGLPVTRKAGSAGTRVAVRARSADGGSLPARSLGGTRGTGSRASPRAPRRRFCDRARLRKLFRPAPALLQALAPLPARPGNASRPAWGNASRPAWGTASRPAWAPLPGQPSLPYTLPWRTPMRAARQADPFTVLGLPARAGLSDDEVRAAWRRIAAATHPDRADGGDAARFAAAAAAYTALRTNSGRAEALADLAPPAGAGRRRAGPGRWPSAPGRARRR